MFKLIALLLCASRAAADHNIQIHHRVHHQQSYQPFGSISPDLSFHPAPDLTKTLTTFDTSPDNVYYHLALQRPHDVDQSMWHFTSVKACHLPQVTCQTIILHMQDNKPFAMDYYVSPIPPHGSCPTTVPRLPFAAFAEVVQNLNTTILLQSPNPPLIPELRKPPPVNPTGQPVEPIPEKSFIQKYWMYIAVALVALLLTGGDEEGPRRQARA